MVPVTTLQVVVVLVVLLLHVLLVAQARVHHEVRALVQAQVLQEDQATILLQDRVLHHLHHQVHVLHDLQVLRAHQAQVQLLVDLAIIREAQLHRRRLGQALLHRLRLLQHQEVLVIILEARHHQQDQIDRLLLQPQKRLEVHAITRHRRRHLHLLFRLHRVHHVVLATIQHR